MERSIRTLLCALALMLAGCGGGGGGGSSDIGHIPSVGGGSAPGVLSISAYPYTSPAPGSDAETLQRLQDAVTRVRNAGAKGQFSSVTWSTLEPNKDQYDQTALNGFTTALTDADSAGLTQLVGLQMINTTRREVPADLVNTAWDSTVMISRFKALLDKLIPSMNSSVRYISLGNEVDPYFFSGHTSEMAGFKTFVAAIQTYLHSKLPNVKVGITITANSYLGSNVQQMLDLTENTDVVIVTYYPLYNNFLVKAPTSPAADFPALLQWAGDRDLVLQEVGYPSSTTLLSSLADQAEFIHQVFAAWRDSNQRIPFLNVFLLHDFSSSLVDTLVTYYGEDSDPYFRAYLASLGLRNTNNTDKPAWPALLQEASSSHLR